MSNRQYFGRIALTLASAVGIAACSADTPTSPPVASQNLTASAPTIALTASAPTIALAVSPLLRNLCYPARAYSVRGCPLGGYVTISNIGGGTLNWTSSKSAAWLRRSPTSGSTPSTIKVWVDGAGLPPGSYYGQIKVWAPGATNSPQTVFVHVTKY